MALNFVATHCHPLSGASMHASSWRGSSHLGSDITGMHVVWQLKLAVEGAEAALETHDAARLVSVGGLGIALAADSQHVRCWIVRQLQKIHNSGE